MPHRCSMRLISFAMLLAATSVAHADDAAMAAKELDNGGRTYLRYCALCHGIDGRGGGPLAESLEKQPPDLTKIAERNGGSYPDDKVKAIIDKGGVKSHGMMAMLAWGKVFKEEIGEDAKAGIIASLNAYIRSLQGR